MVKAGNEGMSEPYRVAMVAALEREVWPLVKAWTRVERDHDGHRFSFFEHPPVVVVCGGIGHQAARRATEAAIVLYHPARVQSIGFAGSLDPALKVGEVLSPRFVVDPNDGSRVDLQSGQGILISLAFVAGAAQKAKLAKAYTAQAVDMEAAAVAHGAHARGIGFGVLKAISDDCDFEMPRMDRFIGADGQFLMARFAAFVLVQPWLWPRTLRLARNTARAADALCGRLGAETLTEHTGDALRAAIGQER